MALAVAASLLTTACRESTSPSPSPAAAIASVTYSQDVAPILLTHCAACHRPGQPAPFSLLDYASARKHASEIVDATSRRYMPPWLPEPGDFLNERQLRQEEINLLSKWVADGALEGDSTKPPPIPPFTDGWQLGPPDLVAQMPQPYRLAPEGQDLYRNFVVPLDLPAPRFVQAVEFHPNSKSIHHVRILLDSTGQAGSLEGRDGTPGFGGMEVPARFPPGHMLTWVPGKTPSREQEGLSWVLEAKNAIVLQIHLQRTGKEELIQPSIGLYFTDRGPTKTSFCIGLLSQLIDIPAGDGNHIVERSFELPVDVQATAVLPHLHFLGRQVSGFALLPNGEKRRLLQINQWDFNWQDEYRYKEPVFLPEGSRIVMRYSYDNSTNNPRNPNQPPRRVRYGPQSVDEMGELWIQVLLRNNEDLARLQTAHRQMDSAEKAAYFENKLIANPADPAVHLALGKVLGSLGQSEEARNHLQRALELQPNLVEAHYFLGMTYYSERRWAEAKREFEATLLGDPKHFHAHDGLGMIALQANEIREAVNHFQQALALNPNDSVARNYLDRLAQP